MDIAVSPMKLKLKSCQKLLRGSAVKLKIARAKAAKGGGSDLKSKLFSKGCNYLVRHGRAKDSIEFPLSLRGKAVLLICLWFPLSESTYIYLRNLKEVYLDLSKKYKNQVEFVLAPLIKSKLDCKATFRKHASAFPFLAVPYDCEKTRLSLFEETCIPTKCYSCCQVRTLAFDRDGKMTTIRTDLPLHFGYACYPFTAKKLHYLSQDRNKFVLPQQPVSLRRILRVRDEDSDLGLTRPDGTRVKALSCSTLTDKKNKRFVGLYLCAEGDFMHKLHEVHQKWKSKGDKYHFEVVLVYLPFNRPKSEALRSFIKRIVLKMSLLRIEDWYVVPFIQGNNHMISRRLWQLYERTSRGDKFIMVDTERGTLDPDARVLLSYYGTESFPFTKERLFEDLLRTAKSLTLQDFGEVTVPDGHLLPLCEVLDSEKTTLVILCETNNPELLNLVQQLTPRWKAFKQSVYASNYDLILVCPVDSKLDAFVADLPWLVARCDKEQASIVSQKIEKAIGYKSPTVVAFCQGKLCSLRADEYMFMNNFTGLPDDDLLESELYEILNDRHDYNNLMNRFKLVSRS